MHRRAPQQSNVTTEQPHKFSENHQEKTGEVTSANQGTTKAGGKQSQLSGNEQSKRPNKGQQKQQANASAKQGTRSINVIALVQQNERGEERDLTKAEHEKRVGKRALAQATHESSNEGRGEQVKQGTRKPALLLTTNVAVMNPSQEKPKGLEVSVFMDNVVSVCLLRRV